MTVIYIIGWIVVLRFLWKKRRWFMDRTAFFDEVKALRTCITKGYTDVYKHAGLDNIVRIVTGKGDTNVSNTDREQLSLKDDVARIIKRIKANKEQKELSAKAEEVLETLEKSL